MHQKDHLCLEQQDWSPGLCSISESNMETFVLYEDKNDTPAMQI